MVTSAHSVTVGTWADIPAPIRGHCMARVAPGVYQHHRLDLVIVVLAETNAPTSISALMGEVTAHYDREAAREAARS